MRKSLISALPGVGELPASTLFLDLSIVYPGDILQVRGLGRTSSLIAKTSGGTYSHVAMAVSSFMLFESLNDGIGETHLVVDRVERRPVRGNGNRLLSALLDGGKPIRHARLLRPAAWQYLDAGARRDLSDTLGEVLFDFWGLAYPSWGDLVPAASVVPGRRLRKIAEAIAHHLDRGPMRPGPFCSQLIGLALHRMGSNVAPRLRRDCMIGPNHFKRGKYFVEVKDAIVRADPRAELAYSNAEIARAFPSNALVRKLGARKLVADWVQARERMDTLIERLSTRFPGESVTGDRSRRTSRRRGESARQRSSARAR